jgi:hypothetical protein
MNSPSRSYQDELLKALSDPAEAEAYLNAALDDGSEDVFLLALENVAQARRRYSHSERKAEAEPANLMGPDIRKLCLSDLPEIFTSLGIRFAAQAK